MKIAYIHPLGGNLYMIAPVSGAHPDQGLPGHGHPDNTLPGMPGYPSQGLPPVPGRPDNSLPTAPGAPDNTLPSPPQVAPGQTLVLVRGPSGKWHYAALQPGSPVPTPLPTPPATATPKS